MAGERDDRHNKRLFSGRRLHCLRWAHGHGSLTAYVFWHMTQARNKVCLSRRKETEKLRLSVARVLISVLSVSLVTFGKVPRSLSVSRSLCERLDMLRSGRRMCPCHRVPFDISPKPHVLHETSQSDICERGTRAGAAPAVQRFKRLRHFLKSQPPHVYTAVKGDGCASDQSGGRIWFRNRLRAAIWVLH